MALDHIHFLCGTLSGSNVILAGLLTPPAHTPEKMPPPPEAIKESYTALFDAQVSPKSGNASLR